MLVVINQLDNLCFTTTFLGLILLFLLNTVVLWLIVCLVSVVPALL